jgi:hypothetical protein
MLHWSNQDEDEEFLSIGREWHIMATNRGEFMQQEEMAPVLSSATQQSTSLPLCIPSREKEIFYSYDKLLHCS